MLTLELSHFLLEIKIDVLSFLVEISLAVHQLLKRKFMCISCYSKLMGWQLYTLTLICPIIHISHRMTRLLWQVVRMPGCSSMILELAQGYHWVSPHDEWIFATKD